MSIKVLKGDVNIQNYFMPNSKAEFVYNKPIYLGSGLGTATKKDEIPSDDVVRNALLKVLPEITKSRLWFAIYRPLVMVGKIKNGMFEQFKSYIEGLLDELPKPIDAHDLQSKLDVQSFQKNVEDWNPDDAPAQGKYFMSYYNLATKFLGYLTDTDIEESGDDNTEDD